jgi:acetoin utilization deacetylase AcuC-like enzyme
LTRGSAAPVTEADLLRVHTADYVEAFRATAAEGGGELGLRAPFGPDGYDIACLSAGLAKAALFATLRGEVENAYALSRPPGHHCLPDFPNGFCLLNNIAIAVEAAFDAGLSSGSRCWTGTCTTATGPRRSSTTGTTC